MKARTPNHAERVPDVDEHIAQFVLVPLAGDDGEIRHDLLNEGTFEFNDGSGAGVLVDITSGSVGEDNRRPCVSLPLELFLEILDNFLLEGLESLGVGRGVILLGLVLRGTLPLFDNLERFLVVRNDGRGGESISKSGVVDGLEPFLQFHFLPLVLRFEAIRLREEGTGDLAGGIDILLAKDDGGGAISILPRRKSLVSEEPKVALLAKFGREILGGISFLGGGGWSLGIGFSADFRAVFAEEQTKILSDGQSALELGDSLHGLYPVGLGLGGGDGLLHLA